MMRLFTLVFFLAVQVSLLSAQPNTKDSLFIRSLHQKVLTEGQSYEWLRHLTTKIGHRLSGSPQAALAVEYTRQMLDTLRLDEVRLQACMVPHWVRGDIGRADFSVGAEAELQELTVLALGNSVGGKAWGEILEARGVEALEKMNKADVQGKIVYFSEPMDPSKLNTFEAYGRAVNQRYRGPAVAADMGAAAVIVRSVTTSIDDYPHTGTMQYREDGLNIPAVAVSTLDANNLEELLKRKELLMVNLETNSRMLPPVESHNVIGEIRGSERPNEIILVGGHLDSWDVGHGAHDDGAGCVQAMEVLHLLKKMGYQPKRTIRCVLFMNEENGGAGAKKYAEESNLKGEKHILAIESDAGGFTPRGFSFDAENSKITDLFRKVQVWSSILDDYHLELSLGGSGADIGPLESQGGLLSGYRPDSQRYFDIHHAASDVFEAVNKRELELGAAAMAALVYLADKYGL